MKSRGLCRLTVVRIRKRYCHRLVLKWVDRHQRRWGLLMESLERIGLWCGQQGCCTPVVRFTGQLLNYLKEMLITQLGNFCKRRGRHSHGLSAAQNLRWARWVADVSCVAASEIICAGVWGWSSMFIKVDTTAAMSRGAATRTNWELTDARVHGYHKLAALTAYVHADWNMLNSDARDAIHLQALQDSERSKQHNVHLTSTDLQTRVCHYST